MRRWVALQESLWRLSLLGTAGYLYYPFYINWFDSVQVPFKSGDRGYDATDVIAIVVDVY